MAWARYWKYLLSIFVFPTIFVLGGSYLHFPIVVLIVLFVAAFALSIWPCVRFRAPFTFGLAGMAAWVVGIVVAVAVVTIVQVVRWLITH